MANKKLGRLVDVEQRIRLLVVQLEIGETACLYDEKNGKLYCNHIYASVQYIEAYLETKLVEELPCPYCEKNFKDTFEKIMIEHVHYTVKGVIALLEDNKMKAKKYTTKLYSNINRWQAKLGLNRMHDRFNDLMVKHIDLVVEYAIDEIDDPSGIHTTIPIIDNGNEIKRFFLNVKRIDIQLFWVEHLNCTVDYITALAKTRDKRAFKFVEATQICKKRAKEFGDYLDQQL